MIAQIGFIVFLIGVVAYAGSQARRSRLMAYTIMAAAVIGIVLVAFPWLSTSLANALGIGRGADLLIYLFVLIGGFSIVNLHLRMRSRDEITTALARAIALQNVRPPS